MSRPKFCAGRWLVPALLSSLVLSGCVTTQAEQPDAAGNAAGVTAGGTAKAGATLDPAYRDLLLSHGARALETEKYEEAGAAYKRVLSVDPEDGDAVLGMVQARARAREARADRRPS